MGFYASVWLLISSLICSWAFMLSPTAVLRPPSSLLHLSRWSSKVANAQRHFELLGRRSSDVMEGNFESLADDDEDDFGPDGIKVNAIDKNDNEWMFFDVAKINVKGGDGGDGCMAMQREFRIAFGGPCGGNGGDGGSIYLKCDKRLNTLGLLRRRVHHRGKCGTNGRGDSRHGNKAEDVFVPVPPGTIVRDSDGVLAGELNTDGQTLVVARGGKGGRGNEHFKTSRMNAPMFAEKGEPGDERWLQIELKLIADVGLVGIPNAGKSTLLAASSNAKPKIADYPFTTIVPNLGVCDLFSDYQPQSTSAADPGSSAPAAALVIADIPGLLEGAHAGVGLGMAFLRHVQRCRVLIHMINGNSEDPVGDFLAIQQELLLFNPKLAHKTQVVVVNKIDVPEVRERLPELTQLLRSAAGHSRVLGISALTGERVKELMQRVHGLVALATAQDSIGSSAIGASKVDRALQQRSAVGRATVQELFTEEEERVSFAENPTDKEFEVLTDDEYPGQFRVVGRHIEKVVSMTNWDYYEAVRRFQRILEAEGIAKALREAGAKQGDLVMVGEWDFNYWEPRNRWIAELGLENVDPRKRPSFESDGASGAMKGKKSRG
eukprot:gene9207-10862_t